MSQELSTVENINIELNRELSNEKVMNALIATTFKKFTPQLVRQAIMEGMIRGFTFKEFIEKDVYAIAYGSTYSLVTSIDYARKVAMRSGLVGKSAPTFTYRNNKVESCSITVKKKTGADIGEYTATVFFEEYYSGNKNTDGTVKTNNYGDVKPTLWDTKPMTMIAKVAEMHALRMAFPEETAKTYIEEELEKDRPAVNHMLDKDGPAMAKASHLPVPAEHDIVMEEDVPDEETQKIIEAETNKA